MKGRLENDFSLLEKHSIVITHLSFGITHHHHLCKQPAAETCRERLS